MSGKLTTAQTAENPDKARARVNLERAAILLLDNAWGVEILSRIFTGFGARNLYRCRTVAEATKVVEEHQIDLIVTETLIDDEDVFGFVRTLRLRGESEAKRFAPVILLSAHTATQKVAEARDCGANFFVAKPLSPKVIMDRVLWVANGKRQYLQTDNYVGPDRRFHDEAPAPGAGRRRTDPKTETETETEEKCA